VRQPQPNFKTGALNRSALGPGGRDQRGGERRVRSVDQHGKRVQDFASRQGCRLLVRFVIQEEAGVVRRYEVAARVVDRCVSECMGRTTKGNPSFGVVIGDVIRSAVPSTTRIQHRNAVPSIARGGAVVDQVDIANQHKTVACIALCGGGQHRAIKRPHSYVTVVVGFTVGDDHELKHHPPEGVMIGLNAADEPTLTGDASQPVPAGHGVNDRTKVAGVDPITCVIPYGHVGDRHKPDITTDSVVELPDRPVGDDDMLMSEVVAIITDPDANTVAGDGVTLQVDRDTIGGYCDAIP
jgi:hypothetical protein